MSLQHEANERQIVEKRGESITAVVTSTIFAVVVNMLPGWNIGFLTPALTAVLPAVTLSLVVDGASHLSLAFYSPRYLHHALHALMAGFSFNAARVVYTVYPFDFSGVPALPLDLLAKIALIVGMVGSGISLIVNGIRFLFARKR
jgi:hypothetical protein